MKIFFIGLFFFTSTGHACWSPIATSTVYYTPDAKKICGRYGFKCADFVKEVKMQGSGKLSPTQMLTFEDKTKALPANCATTTGAAGICLVPYISVAADADYYNMGDIISMPGMKGQKIKAPDGSEIIHPGYFIVHDVGGAIDGRSRFDFYTGPMDLNDKNNSFGYKASKKNEPDTTTLYDEKACDARKKFSRIKPNSKGFAEIKMKLEAFEKVMFEKSKNMVINVKPKSGVVKKPDSSSVIKKVFNYLKDKVQN